MILIWNKSRCQFWLSSSVWCKVSPSSFNNYMKDSKSDQTSTMHQYCFEQLIRQIWSTPEWRTSPFIDKPLKQFESILKDNNYKLFNSYSSARLKQCLVKYYSSENCFGEVQWKKHTNQFLYSSPISVPEVLNIAANYKRELKDHELIDEPIDCKNKILKQAENILISDIENAEGVTVHPLDPCSISCVAVLEKVSKSRNTF